MELVLLWNALQRIAILLAKQIPLAQARDEDRRLC